MIERWNYVLKIFSFKVRVYKALPFVGTISKTNQSALASGIPRRCIEMLMLHCEGVLMSSFPKIPFL